MQNKNRVFITGLSALTACGNSAQSTWDAILAKESQIKEITQWDLTHWDYRLGGELKDFEPAKRLPDRKLLKAISKQDVLGINAAMQAVNQSGLIDYRDQLDNQEQFNNVTGLYVGSPGNKYFQQEDFLPLLSKTENMEQFAKELFNEVHPMWLLRILPNNVLAYTGITYGFKGPNHNFTNHAVSGAQAILEAYQAIQQGQIERALVVAYDVLEPQALFYYKNIGVLSPRHLKPFGIDHDGTILGDGAAALVLESESSVKERKAVCYGEIIGGATTTEAQGLFSIESSGESLANLIKMSAELSEGSVNDIDVIIAHGNGNPKSDMSEANAIKQVVGKSIPVTAFKWAMGHTLAASGILDTVLATLTLKEGCIPGVPNLTSQDELASGLNISASHRDLSTGKKALIINRGFAGINVCLVIKSCE